MTFKYTVNIEIDESAVKEKYPNYTVNFDTPQQLADSIAFGLETEGETNMRIDGLQQWGYSISVEQC